MNQVNFVVKLEPEVINFLNNRNRNIITLIVKTNGGGCCPTFESADVEFKKPENSQNYHHIQQDGFDLYITKTAKVSTPVLKFVLRKSFLSKTVVPLGLQLKTHE